MIIPCFRCGKKIDTPSASNADYIIASDTVVQEQRETLFALKHNQLTLDREAAGLPIADDELDKQEIPCFEASKHIGSSLAKVVVETVVKDVQKTAIICPRCYKPTDFLIWGVHKKSENERWKEAVP